MKRALLPLAVLAAGALVALVITQLSPEARRRAPRAMPARVEVLAATPVTLPARVFARGEVEPTRRVSLSAEVAGRLVEVAAAMRPGGRVQEGALLARVDPRDYRLAIATAESRVRTAEAELALERGRQTVARREYELLGKGDPEDNPLALRRPQLAAAEQALEAAKGQLEKARLDLERTAIRAPFDALVVSESAEVGRVVAPGTEVAELIGSEVFRVRVAVPVDELAVIALPGEGTEGSTALVSDRLADTGVRTGRVIGLTGELDRATRTATVLVEVEDPLDPQEGVPLLAGSFVEAEIDGVALENVFRIPRTAITEGNGVWLVGPEDTLLRRTVDVAWRTPSELIVRGGIEAGDRVVVSPLALPVQGMKVEVTSTVNPGADAEVGARGPAAPAPL